MFCVELGVKMFVTWRHFACLDRGDLRFAQLGRALDATVALRQAHEILVGHQHGPRTAVLGDDHRLAYGGVLIGAEVLIPSRSLIDSWGGFPGGHRYGSRRRSPIWRSPWLLRSRSALTLRPPISAP